MTSLKLPIPRESGFPPPTSKGISAFRVKNKVKAEKLHHLIEQAFQKKRVLASDPYFDRLKNIMSALDHFIDEADEEASLKIHEGALNGLTEALEGCYCEECEPAEGLAGISENTPIRQENTIMNSLDFGRLKFQTIGFTGKWKDLIGDPCEGFTAMVFGKPKMGKSYLCVDFAGYLARNHGRTLYVAKEEKLDHTLQMKLKDKQVEHPLLDVSDHIPADLSRYQFIILDSVNKLGLTPEDLNRLKGKYPSVSFIFVFQTTKEGRFRGANTFQHDVDIVIEVPEKGKAVQFGRFNQGGEMDIFVNDPDYYQNAA
jgi:hypothetical protein